MADLYYALNGGGLTGSPPDPAITELPEAYNRDILKRQNLGTYDVCGYYSIPWQFWVVNYCYYSGASTTTVQPVVVTLDVKDISRRGALLH
ncbi:hypothetical protein DER46DRAFT_612550 [Fusarium sp. MPI-SDFR-AT-0072]|nr:hypothetical protein DER46DRAFT_612550 [Fusarium sp. MPI-SDFR-AT-0072]